MAKRYYQNPKAKKMTTINNWLHIGRLATINDELSQRCSSDLSV